VGSLLTSDLGRAILADVLHAAADVLRRNREIGQQRREAGQAMIERGAELTSTAMQVGTEAASGAVGTGADITAAAVDIAQKAAGALSSVATNAVLNMIPRAGTGDETRKGSRKCRPER